PFGSKLARHAPCFSPDCRLVAVFGSDLAVFDTSTGEKLWSISGAEWSPVPYKDGSCFSEDSSLLAVEGSYSLGLKLLDAATGAARYRPEEGVTNLSCRTYSRKIVMTKPDASKDSMFAGLLRKCLPEGILPGADVHVEILDLETGAVNKFAV